MNDEHGSRVARLSPERRALLEGRLGGPSPSSGPSGAFAVIGMACRFPGADSPEALWELLCRGRDAITEIPPDRWPASALFDANPDRPGRMSTRWGGFLEEIGAFDADFFAVSPREAERMDPQQRLVLEVAWTALERAGWVGPRLRGASVGVFVGAHSQSSDYAWMQFADPKGIDAYTGTGTAHNMLAGRVSYALDLHGPSIVVDTACSSSLVAMHLACQSLAARECDMAVVAGVNAVLSPLFGIASSKSRLFSADGRCKAFDARANGIVRSEGCGALVLRRAPDAAAHGERVLAVIRGTAVNQDGRTSGLTAPSGPAQRAVIRAALARAQIDPAAIALIETHGTGTSLGDPIEVEALAEVLGDGASPCFLGALKTNLGHLEGAAGIAAVIKAVLCLQHGEIPPNLHFHSLNPHIRLSGTRLQIPAKLERWPREGARFAGVSAFGWSGTNAHAILEGAPPSEPGAASQDQSAPAAALLPLSARSPSALRELAAAWASVVRERPAELLELCTTALDHRARFEHRAAVVGDGASAIAEALSAVAAGAAHPGARLGTSQGDRSRVVLVFSGQGGQSSGMARALMREAPEFAEAFAACDAACAPYLGANALLAMLRDGDVEAAPIGLLQPVLWGIQVAVAELLRRRGALIDGVIGHSMGEVAAAVVAGALGLDDAARVICRRSALLSELRGTGGMAVVELSAEAAHDVLAAHEGRISVAAYNGPRTTVVSGEPAALDALLAELARRDVYCRRVAVDVASHSRGVERLRAPLLDALAGLKPRSAAVTLYSTVTGACCDGAEMSDGYWFRNLREPVRFAQAVARALDDDRASSFVEIGPHPVLSSALREALAASGAGEARVIAALHRGDDGLASVLAACGELFCAGTDFTAARLLGARARPVDAPTYPFQRRPFRLPRSTLLAHERLALGRGHAGGQKEDALLGVALRIAARPGLRVWQAALSAEREPTAFTHAVDGSALLPASSTLARLLAACEAVLGAEVMLDDAAFERAVPMKLDGQLHVQTSALEGADGLLQIELFVSSGDEGWERVARATGRRAPARELGLEALRAARARLEGIEPSSGASLYAVAAERGFTVSAEAPRIARVWSSADEVLAALEEGPEGDEDLAPAAIEASLHALVPLFEGALPVLVGAAGVRSYQAPWRARWVHVARGEGGTSSLAAFDEREQPVWSVASLVLHPRVASGTAADDLDGCIHELAWKQAGPQGQRGATPGRWLVLHDRLGVGTALVAHLRAASVPCEAWSELPSPEALRAAARIVDLRALDATDAQALVASAVSLTQACAASAQEGRTPRIFLVTRGAHAVGKGPVEPGHAAVWGLGRVVAEEHPEHWGGLVDLDPRVAPDEAARSLFEALLRDDGEDQVALRGGDRLVPRLVRAPSTSRRAAFRARPDATYVVTGGLGGVGLCTARWLVERGARHLALLSRRGPADDARSTALAGLRERGVEVEAPALDITDARALHEFLEARRAAGRAPVRGVFHAAAVVRDALIRDLGELALRETLAAKSYGAANLHAALRGEPLDVFVLFSSIGALLGQPGQAAYAAANAYLEGLAEHRRGLGLPALVVHWGLWGGLGLAESAGGARSAAALAEHGLRAFSADEALELLGRVLEDGRSQAFVARIDWRRWDKAHPLHLGPRLLCELGQPRSSAVAPPLRAELAALPPGPARRARLLEYLRGEIAQVLRLGATVLDPAAPLGRYGIDSHMTLEIRRRLEVSTGLALPATLVWNYPTLQALAAHLEGKLAEAREAPDRPGAAAGSGGAASGDAAGERRDAQPAASGDDPLQALLLARLTELGF
ncbi:type I polyketide synthase [Sorangium sp. So ce375]|uniref:type I polyketide synthase n=1 Tax=Sorangium sp. So ce375 TaxID=3133306 RepID=UPI003F5B323F